MIGQISCPLPSASIQLAKDKWVVCFRVVGSFEKEDVLENTRILSCFVQLKSILFNLFVFLFCRQTVSASGWNYREHKRHPRRNWVETVEKTDWRRQRRVCAEISSIERIEDATNVFTYNVFFPVFVIAFAFVSLWKFSMKDSLRFFRENNLRQRLAFACFLTNYSPFSYTFL